MSAINIVNEDIVELEVECLVNATNESLWADTPLSNRIVKRAGAAKMTDACDQISSCLTGNAVVTPGFDLKAKYVIHTVGPVWRGGGASEAMLLERAYRNCMAEVLKLGCTSVAFSLISTEKFRYPVREAWMIALRTVESYLTAHEEMDLQVTFAVDSPDVCAMGRSILEAREWV